MRIPVTIFAVVLAFQASAQENKITVSGRAWGSVENVSTQNATGGLPNVLPRFRVTNDSSYIRVRGDMKLSDDLSAWGQVEAQFTFDGVGIPFDSGRNTGAGFTSKGFGTIMAGRWDSPYKLVVIRLDPWGNTTINNYAAILGSLPNSGNLYDARLGNGVQYWTPIIGGFQVRAAAMVNEDRTSQINPSVLSVSAAYDGPIYVGVAYETRKDCSNANGQAAPNCTQAVLGNAANPHGRDWGVRAGAGINFKPTHSEIGVIYEHLESQADFTAAPTSRTQKRDAYYASLVQGLFGDAHQFVGAIGKANKASGTAAVNDKTDALYYTVAYRYNFNKDLFTYLSWVQIRNGDNATYRFGSSGLTFAAAGALTNPIGADYNGLSVGMRYLF
jgi:predicted porin